MPFKHDLTLALAPANRGGLSEESFAELRRKALVAAAKLRDQRDSGALPLLSLPVRRDDLEDLVPLAEAFRSSFAEVLVLGTGGSSLGGQTLHALADLGFGPERGGPRLRFLDNVDPGSFSALLAHLQPRETGIVVISKSGSTAETLAQLLQLLPRFEAELGARNLARHVAVITEARASPLGRLADARGFQRLAHDPGIGGRFSVLSNVGLLPAMIAGLDAAALRDGAARVCESALSGNSAPPLEGAALMVGLAREAGISQSVLMPYCDRLAIFGLWYRQLWAESLGKGGQGTTPIPAVGAVDQHSQLQLYLDGPRDKVFTLIDVEENGVATPSLVSEDPELAYLNGRTLGALFAAMARATGETLAAAGRPLRRIRLPHLGEEAMGELLMHFMLETMIAAELIGVNAYDQPAVEAGKTLARRYLEDAK